MKIAVAGGHSKACPGAADFIDEYTEDRKVAAALIDELQNRGHSCVSASNEKGTQSSELAEECRIANNSGADLFVAIHFNAASRTDGTRGTEVWHYSTSGSARDYASRVSSRLASVLGLPNRGAKGTKSLYVLRHTIMTAILVEVCFVDARADVDAYNRVGYQAVAAAIADGICNTNQGATANTAAPSAPAQGGSSGGGISVDGWIGVNTNKAAQRYFGTPVDGVMSNQDASLKHYFPRIDSRAINYGGGNGSNLVGAMQRLFGVKDDGFMGPNTVKAMQRFLGVAVDGILGQNTASAWQRWLNEH